MKLCEPTQMLVMVLTMSGSVSPLSMVNMDRVSICSSCLLFCSVLFCFYVRTQVIDPCSQMGHICKVIAVALFWKLRSYLRW